MDTFNLQRFIDAQENDYSLALSEIKNSRKQSHWMWYIFPQLQGLGFSSISNYYSIKNIEEAKAYLHHPVLGNRLIELCTALLQLATNDAHEVFGSPDDLKLRSCLTLFASIEETSIIFQSALDKFYNGQKDGKTLKLLGL